MEAAAIFARKVGHTQRGGRPILFDRFYAAQLGGHAVDVLLEGKMSAVSVLNHTKDRGFHLGRDRLRERFGCVHEGEAGFFPP